jgi:hypothetical protein
MPRAINQIIDYPTCQVTSIEVPWTEADLLEEIAAIRWKRETAGITVGTQAVSTYREEMPIWQGMLLDITFKPGQRTAFEYKPRGGENVALTIQQVLRCYECFAWYIAACFAVERALRDMIDNGTSLNSVAALAMDSATWPQQVFEWNPPS